jgi:adenylosuccinate lyase
MIDRYGLPAMQGLWTLESQYARWLEVELAALSAMESLGEVPAGTYEDVKSKVHVDVDRIAAIEGEIRHDLLAFIRSLEEQTGRSGRFIHRGLTSSDVKDTALSLQMRSGLDLILDEAYSLRTGTLERAKEHKDLVIVGRTHGMHAEPTTLGLKFLLWKTELDRDIERLRRARDRICVGKFSGPVGTYTQVSPQVEEIACRKLGLRPARVANQVLQRDRHAEVLSAIAITGTTLDKIALEIRHLSRTEVGELEEPTPEGSSSMPHKRNPITSERIEIGFSRDQLAKVAINFQCLGQVLESPVSVKNQAPITGQVVVQNGLARLHRQGVLQCFNGPRNLANPLVAPAQGHADMDVVRDQFKTAAKWVDRFFVTA